MSLQEVKATNPLEMSDIIPHILDFLPLENLKICRLVSKTWDHEASGLLRKKRTIVFHRACSINRYINSPVSTLPHAQFDLHLNADHNSPIRMRDGGLTDFFDKCGPHVRKLGIHISTENCVAWPDLGEILTSKVPNLETLVFPTMLPRQDPTRPRVDTSQYQNRSIKRLRFQLLEDDGIERLADILRTVPNLQVIDVIEKQDTSVDTLDFPAFLPRTFVNTRKILVEAFRKSQVSLLRLRKINTNITLNNEDLKALVRLRIPLQQLHVTLEDGVKASAFKGLISSLVPTLSELKVTFPNHFEANPEKLEEHPEESICLLTNLISLHLDNFNWPMRFLMKLPTCFPYLRCLHIPEVDDERLRVIYLSLPMLSELELSDANCTDWGLTGISLEVCNDMLETCSLHKGGERYRTDLYIGSLPFLQKFTVIGTQITDASLALGLADCRRMTELKVGSSLISDQGIIYLLDRLGRQLNSLDVSECTELSDDAKSYAVEMTRGTVKTSRPPSPDRQNIQNNRCVIS